jgi:hypothetical protein
MINKIMTKRKSKEMEIGNCIFWDLGLKQSVIKLTLRIQHSIRGVLPFRLVRMENKIS